MVRPQILERLALPGQLVPMGYREILVLQERPVLPATLAIAVGMAQPAQLVLLEQRGQQVRNQQ